jgi:hypothetical protein
LIFLIAFISCSNMLDLLASAPIDPDCLLVTPAPPTLDVPPLVYIQE